MGFIGAHAQVNPIFVGNLPLEIDESSGLEFTSEDNLWSHNDTDFDPRIFKVDETGVLISSLDLTNVTVVDFEDVAFDGLINFYIGDFGNNLNDRTDLKVYKIPNPELLSGSIVPEVINFTLSDQSAFPPSENNMNFDIEAMFFFNDHLHLFTRNRTNPFDGLIKHYKLPAEAGEHVAQLQGAFFGNLSDEYSSATGADISPDGTRMALLTEGSVFLFYDYTGDDFFNGQSHYNFFDDVTSKEGLVFIDACQIMICEESPDGINPGRLLSLNSCDLVPIGIENSTFEEAYFNVNVLSNSIMLESRYSSEFRIEIYDSKGSILYSEKESSNLHNVDTNNYKSGTYVIRLTNDNGTQVYKILITSR